VLEIFEHVLAVKGSQDKLDREHQAAFDAGLPILPLENRELTFPI
jgi:hypothetical protein